MEWEPYNGLSEEDYLIAKKLGHIAIQCIASVGRAYYPNDTDDSHAFLQWVPGYWRMGGKWVTGEEKTFRTSICFKSFAIYLVDQKVSTLAHYDLFDKSISDVMVWMEQQILSFGLGSRHISLSLPYKLPFEVKNKTKIFERVSPQIFYEYGKLYHNTYLILTDLKKEFTDSSEILIDPQFFEISMTITLKETGEKATNTMVTIGFSPGDESFDMPYYFVNSWPNVIVEDLEPLAIGIWYTEERAGSMVKQQLINETENPAHTLLNFYSESISIISKQLLA